MSQINLDDEIAFEIALMPYGGKLTVYAGGLIEGLSNLLEVAYAAPRHEVNAVVTNYIPDLIRQHGPKQRPDEMQLSFSVVKAEAGAWVLSECRIWEDARSHFVCADDEALYDQMRAWTERQIGAHRKFQANKSAVDSGPYLSAARDVAE